MQNNVHLVDKVFQNGDGLKTGLTSLRDSHVPLTISSFALTSISFKGTPSFL